MQHLGKHYWLSVWTDDNYFLGFFWNMNYENLLFEAFESSLFELLELPFWIWWFFKKKNVFMLRKPIHLLGLTQKTPTRTNWTTTCFFLKKLWFRLSLRFWAKKGPRTNWTTLKEFKVINRKEKRVVQAIGQIVRVEIKRQVESSCSKQFLKLHVPLKWGYGGFHKRHQLMPRPHVHGILIERTLWA